MAVALQRSGFWNFIPRTIPTSVWHKECLCKLQEAKVGQTITLTLNYKQELSKSSLKCERSQEEEQQAAVCWATSSSCWAQTVRRCQLDIKRHYPLFTGENRCTKVCVFRWDGLFLDPIKRWGTSCPRPWRSLADYGGRLIWAANKPDLTPW